MGSFNPESGLLNRNAERLPEAEEALYKVLVPENEEKAIKLEDFADLYDKESLKIDQEYVETREEQFRTDGTPEAAKKYGKLFEAIVNDQIENSDLMGPAAKVIVPSRYDDIKNGIDSIVRFKGETGAPSHLALAIDVTRSKTEVAAKFERIRKSIQSGQLSKLKYFKTKGYRGELDPVARVVVGADHAITEDISSLILTFMRMKKTIAENRRLNIENDTAKELPLKRVQVLKKLAAHPLQQIVLTEIRAQLEAFHAYALQCDKEVAADKYAEMLHIIADIIDAKDGPSNKENNAIVDNDEVYQIIMESAKAFGR